MDPQSRAALQAAFRRAGRSLLQYVGDAYPWAGPREQPLLKQLQAVIAEDSCAIAGLADFLRHRHIPLPYLGAYPMGFTDINFVALRYLLPKLVEDRRRDLAALERDLAQAKDPDARAVLQQMLLMNREHLKTLEELVAAETVAAAS